MLLNKPPRALALFRLQMKALVGWPLPDTEKVDFCSQANFQGRKCPQN